MTEKIKQQGIAHMNILGYFLVGQLVNKLENKVVAAHKCWILKYC